MTSEPQPSGREAASTIIAVLGDGPLGGTRIEAEIVEGRPPSTVDVLDDDGSTCRYCLTEWNQSGPAAEYEYLYRV